MNVSHTATTGFDQLVQNIHIGEMTLGDAVEKIRSGTITEDDIFLGGISPETFSHAVVMALTSLSPSTTSQITNISSSVNRPLLKFSRDANTGELQLNIYLSLLTPNMQELQKVISSLYSPFDCFSRCPVTIREDLIKIDSDKNNTRKGVISIPENLIVLFVKEIICPNLCHESVLRLLKCLINAADTGLGEDEIIKRIEDAPQRLLRSQKDFEEFFKKPTRTNTDQRLLVDYITMPIVDQLVDKIKIIISLGNKDDIKQLCDFLSQEKKIDQLDPCMDFNSPDFKWQTPLHFLLETLKDTKKAQVLYAAGARDCSANVFDNTLSGKFIDRSDLLVRYGFQEAKSTACALF